MNLEDENNIQEEKSRTVKIVALLVEFEGDWEKKTTSWGKK